jgi:hypothetical protein
MLGIWDFLGKVFWQFAALCLKSIETHLRITK